MIPTRLCSKGWFPYKALVAYQRCVDNPTINCEMGALRYRMHSNLCVTLPQLLHPIDGIVKLLTLLLDP